MKKQRCFLQILPTVSHRIPQKKQPSGRSSFHSIAKIHNLSRDFTKLPSSSTLLTQVAFKCSQMTWPHPVLDVHQLSLLVGLPSVFPNVGFLPAQLDKELKSKMQFYTLLFYHRTLCCCETCGLHHASSHFSFLCGWVYMYIYIYIFFFFFAKKSVNCSKV